MTRWIPFSPLPNLPNLVQHCTGHTWLLGGCPLPKSCGSLLQQRMACSSLGIFRLCIVSHNLCFSLSWAARSGTCRPMASSDWLWYFQGVFPSGQRPITGSRTESSLTCKSRWTPLMTPWASDLPSYCCIIGALSISVNHPCPHI